MSAPGRHGAAEGGRRPPRVLVLTHSLSGVDGVGRYGCGLLRHLAPRCERIEIHIGRGHRGFSEDFPRAGNVEVRADLPLGHVPLPGLLRMAWLVASTLPGLVAAARRADVVHSFADYPLGFLAVLVARLAGRPVVVSGHGTYSVAPLSYPVHRTLLRWMFRRTDRFLMGAEFALRQVLARARPRGAEVVPYGCVPADYDAHRAAGEAPGVPEPYVLCVGEVKPRKGYAISVPAFLQAWARRPELHFAVVGRHASDDPYFRGLQDQVAAAGADGHVHWLGNVSEARKVALMRGCRAFLLTPITSDEGGFEAFGLVYLEAGAAGRPVVGVSDSGAESAIDDDVNGRLLAPDDVSGIADALVRLATDDALAERMGAAGRARAARQTWAAAAERVEQVWAELRDEAEAEAAGAPAGGGAR